MSGVRVETNGPDRTFVDSDDYEFDYTEERGVLRIVRKWRKGGQSSENTDREFAIFPQGAWFLAQRL